MVHLSQKKGTNPFIAHQTMTKANIKYSGVYRSKILIEMFLKRKFVLKLNGNDTPSKSLRTFASFSSKNI